MSLKLLMDSDRPLDVRCSDGICLAGLSLLLERDEVDILLRVSYPIPTLAAAWLIVVRRSHVAVRSFTDILFNVSELSSSNPYPCSKTVNAFPGVDGDSVSDFLRLMATLSCDLRTNSSPSLS